MGFLLGAFGKQMAGKRLRALQARMMNVQSQLRRATRDIEAREKFWSRVEKDNKNAMTATLQTLTIGIQQSMQNSVWAGLAEADIKGVDGNQIDIAKLQKYDQATWQNLDKETLAMIQEQMSTQNSSNAAIQQALQATLQQQMSLNENMIEAAKEQDLRALKELEDDLQTEKDSLESQIQLAQADYDGCKEMEKAGAKNMVPQYTGQG